MRISEIRQKILSSLSDNLADLGFDTLRCPTFYNFREDIVRIIHIDFLSNEAAAYFRSTTASFQINLAVFLNLAEIKNQYPKEYEAEIRGHLIRDFRQKHPMGLKGYSLFHPDRRRKDIWWIEKDGENLNQILDNASRLIYENAMDWLNKYSDIDFLADFLKKKKENEPWKGGPFGFGAIGSASRKKIVLGLERKRCKTDL